MSNLHRDTHAGEMNSLRVNVRVTQTLSFSSTLSESLLPTSSEVPPTLLLLPTTSIISALPSPQIAVSPTLVNLTDSTLLNTNPLKTGCQNSNLLSSSGDMTSSTSLLLESATISVANLNLKLNITMAMVVALFVLNLVVAVFIIIAVKKFSPKNIGKPSPESVSHGEMINPIYEIPTP